MVLKYAAGNYFPGFLCPFQDPTSYESCAHFKIYRVVSSYMPGANDFDEGRTGVFGGWDAIQYFMYALSWRVIKSLTSEEIVSLILLRQVRYLWQTDTTVLVWQVYYCFRRLFW
jgi:hypothetical protein